MSVSPVPVPSSQGAELEHEAMTTMHYIAALTQHCTSTEEHTYVLL
jgi:hypothetical protein